MVLAALDSLLIRALHSQFAHTVSLRGAVLEGAKTLPAGRHANSVEICMCPANYLGDSCQVDEADSLSFGDFSVLGHIGYVATLSFLRFSLDNNNQNLKDILKGWFWFVNMKHFVLNDFVLFAQECAPGYYRDTFGLFLGKCVPCNCNGHSDRCLDGSGVCVVRKKTFEIFIVFDRIITFF